MGLPMNSMPADVSRSVTSSIFSTWKAMCLIPIVFGNDVDGKTSPRGDMYCINSMRGPSSTGCMYTTSALTSLSPTTDSIQSPWR